MLGKKRQTSAIIVFTTATLLVLVGCTEEELKGACVTVDGADAYCFEDKTDSYCSGSGYTFHEDSSCSAVGFGYYCTPTDMRKSGSTIYGSSRYLRSADCDSTKGGSGSSTPGGGTKPGGGTTPGGGNNGDDVPQSCATNTVQGCTLTFCAGGGQGCYYVSSGSKFQCSSCNDITDCLQSAVDRCQGN